MRQRLIKPDLILTDDWHLREDTPICWTGDFQKEQWNSVDFVSELQKKYNCRVVHAGDLYDKSKITTYLAKITARHIPNQFYTIYGQHDLPNHNITITEKCGIDLLAEVNKLEILHTCHFGQIPEIASFFVEGGSSRSGREILVWHKMTWKNELPFPGCEDSSAKELLKKYPQFDLICTGDNHKTFVEEYKGRILVNAGSLTRQTADQINHKPCVFLWYAKTNTVEQVFIPIQKGVISREHLKAKEKRDGRIEAFVSSLDTDWDTEMNFEANLEKFYGKNDVKNEVKEIITKAIEK